MAATNCRMPSPANKLTGADPLSPERITRGGQRSQLAPRAEQRATFRDLASLRPETRGAGRQVDRAADEAVAISGQLTTGCSGRRWRAAAEPERYLALF